MKGILEPDFLPKPVWATRGISMPRGSRINRIICTLSVLLVLSLVCSHYYGSYDHDLHRQPSTPGGTWSSPIQSSSSAPINHSSFATAASSSFHHQPTAKPQKTSVDALGAPLPKPAGIPIIAVIFYGRRNRASILECYLRKNLASHGGWLDEVIWAVNTDNEGDRVYGQGITESAPEYKYLPISTPDGENETPYTQVWYDAFKNESAIYLKIDDDVVFAEDNAIPRMVTTLVNNPEALLVSSNVVNNPALGWLHYHMGAVHPYMPQVEPVLAKHLASRENGIWRPSELPRRIEPPEEPRGVDEYHYMFDVEYEEDIPKHRWYPVNDYNYLTKTPVAASEYDAFGNNLWHWPLAAQAHYSLLQNIEENGLGRYYMVHDIAKRNNGASSTWQMTGTRLSINFMALRGRDVFEYRDTIARNDDEQTLTVDLPGEIGRSVLVETTSIVAHYTFGPQKGVAATDILERYHNYAKEKVCSGHILEPEYYWEYDDPPTPPEPKEEDENPEAEEYDGTEEMTKEDNKPLTSGEELALVWKDESQQQEQESAEDRLGLMVEEQKDEDQSTKASAAARASWTDSPQKSGESSTAKQPVGKLPDEPHSKILTS